MSSSIFSSEYLCRWWALPTRTHAWHALLVLGALAMIGGASALVRASDDRVYRSSASLERAAEARVAILGNSQFQFLPEDEFAIPTEVMGIPGSDFAIQVAAFLANAPRMPKLELVLVGFCNVPLRMAGLENRAGDYEDLTAWGVPWYAIPGIPPTERLIYGISYHPLLKPLLIGPNFDITSRLWERVTALPVAAAASESSPSAPAQDPLGVVEPGFHFAPNQGAEKMATYVKQLANSPQLDLNRDSLLRLLDYCEAEGIEVALLRSPTTREFWSARPEQWDAELETLYADMREAHPGMTLPIWDAEHAEQYPTAWFHDGNHMRPIALSRYTQYLNDKIAAAFDGQNTDDGIASVLSREGAAAVLQGITVKLSRPELWKYSDGVALRSVGACDYEGQHYAHVFAITMPPGSTFYQPDYLEVAPGEQACGLATLWTDAPFEKVHGFVIGVGRHPDGPAAANSEKITQLGAVPKQYIVSLTFQQGYPMARFQITNQSSTAISFFLAEPELKRFPPGDY